MVILQPGLVEVGPPQEEIKIDKLETKVFDKLKSEDNEDSGTRQSRPTPKRRATKRRKPSVLGEAAKNKGGAQKV